MLSAAMVSYQKFSRYLIDITDCLSWWQTVAALVPNGNFYGESLQDAALVNQWTHRAETEFDAYLGWLYYICSGIYPYNKAVSLFRSPNELELTADLLSWKPLCTIEWSVRLISWMNTWKLVPFSSQSVSLSLISRLLLSPKRLAAWSWTPSAAKNTLTSFAIWRL